MARGLLSHVDFSVADPAASVRFYDALLTALGFARVRAGTPEWQDPGPTRAAWAIRYPDGTHFGIDLRPAERDLARRYDRRAPGPHHLAFQVGSDAEVEAVHAALRSAAAHVLDPPAHYGGTPGYGEHYYAVFFADPDGFKVEVVHAPGFTA